MNEKWFARSVSDVEKKLKTNAASGLSRKAARWRYKRERGNIFERRPRSVLSLLGDLVADFALIMLIVMSAIALFFEEYSAGVTASVIIVFYLASAMAIYYRGEKFSESLEDFFVPNCRVIRDGKLFSVRAPYVVPGDVILLGEGDVAACDARLVSSDSLKVKMLVEKNKYVLLDKAAEGVVSENENDIRRHLNIVHAGSIVLGGSARAIVTAVGKYTYIGAKEGSIAPPPREKNRSPEILKSFRKYCSALSLWLLLIILPFSAIGLYFGDGELSLFTVFVTALAVAASSMAQFATTVCRTFFALRIKKCASAEDASVIRSCEALDKLASADHVFILDGSAVTDGVLHLDSVCTAAGEIKNYRLKDRTVQKLCELSILYDGAQRAALSTGTQSLGRYDSGIKEFIECTDGDRAALNIRCKISGFASGDSHGRPDMLFYTDMGEQYILYVSYSDEIVSRCEYVSVDGREERLSDSGRAMLSHKHRAYVSEGKRVLVLSYSKNDGYGADQPLCFVGMMVFSERADTSAGAALARLAEYGLKPVFFKNTSVGGVLPDVSRIPASVLGDSVITPLDLRRETKPVWYGFGNYTCYSGFDASDVCELIAFLQKKGKRIAVLGFSEKYGQIYRAADLFVSCSADKYSVGRFESEIEVLKSNDDLTCADTPQVLKQTADIIIPRPSQKKSGGLLSLLEAFRAARTAYGNIADFFRYVICVQFVRMLLVMVPMLFGSVALDARHVLLGGMVIDILAMISFAADDRSTGDDLGKYRGILNEFSAPIRNNAGMILSFGAAALIAAVLPELFSALSFAPNYIDKTEYSFVAFVLLHIAVFGSMKLKNLRKHKIKALDRATLTVPIISLLLLVACFVFDGLSKAFGIEGFAVISYLFLAFVPAVLGVVLYMLIGELRIEKNKNQ